MTRLPLTQQKRIDGIEHGKRDKTLGVVIHDIEGTAEGALSWFANPAAGGVGAHVIHGRKASYQVADLDAVCWHAPGANQTHIGFEHEGYARWKVWQWLRLKAMLSRSANRAAWVCYHYGLGEPRRGRNIFTHAEFPAGGHHDPGKGFPFSKFYMRKAQTAYRNLVRTKGKSWS